MKHLISISIIFSITLMLVFSGTDANIIHEEEKSLVIEEESEAQPLGQVDTPEINTYYDVPLSHELQDYTREVCEEYDIDMEVVLGIMKTESDFRHNVSSKNNIGGGRSVGICQLNENHIDWYGELTGLGEKFDINNIKNNILGGINIYLSYNNYWKNKGYINNELLFVSLLSYNRGVSGATKYLKKYNFEDDDYIQKTILNINIIKKSIISKTKGD